MTSINRKPIWTNNAEWQDQQTGETTEAGKQHLIDKNQLQTLKETNMSKFAKKTETTESTEDNKKAVKASKPAKEKAPKAEKAEKKSSKKEDKKPAKKEKVKSDDTRKITVLVKQNPKREGSKAYKMFELYGKNKTVADFLKAGGTTSCLRFDESAGFIKVA